MIKNIICTALMAGLPLSAYASGPERPISSPELAEPIVPQRPTLSFFIGGGGGVEPAFFGSNDYVLKPKFALSFGFLRLPSGQTFGSEDPDYLPTGFSPRGSLRIISERTAADNPELTGLKDVDLSVELGLGVAYLTNDAEASPITALGDPNQFTLRIGVVRRFTLNF